jgi:hypothetical protein
MHANHVQVAGSIQDSLPACSPHRNHHSYISPLYQASLVDAMSTSAQYIPAAAKVRPGQGPGPIVAIKRVLPAPAPLQPVRMTSGAKKGDKGPFIFNPYEAKRQALADGQADSALPEWVSAACCRGSALQLRAGASATRGIMWRMTACSTAQHELMTSWQPHQQMRPEQTRGKGTTPHCGEMPVPAACRLPVTSAAWR